MAGLDLSAASNVLKNFYLGPIREQLNNSSILLSRLDRDETTQDVYGKNFTVPLRNGRNDSAGLGRADDGAAHTAGRQGYTTITVPNKYLYAKIRVTGPTIKATRSKAGAFITAIESEIKGATRDFKRAMNRQLHGDGRDALAFWTGADDSSGTNVDDGQGNAFVHLLSGSTYDLIDASDNSTVLGNDIVVTVGAKGARLPRHLRRHRTLLPHLNPLSNAGQPTFVGAGYSAHNPLGLEDGHKGIVIGFF